MDASTAPVAPAAVAASRRRLLYGGVALAAAAAGAVVAWRRFEPGAVDSGALDTLWASSFDTPGGAVLPMQGFRGKPLLINFWATWCPPCIEEMPMIDAFYRENAAKSWQVLGLAIDQPSAVKAFLLRLPVSFPIGLAGLEGTALGKSLGNVTGGLPFSVVISAAGRVLHRKMGRLSDADLAQWARLQ